MRIAFFEIEGWEESIVTKAFPSDHVFLTREKITSPDVPDAETYEVLSVFVNSHIDDAVLDRFPAVKCITTRSVGYDHIDLLASKKRNITVLYAPGYGDNTVAEFTFGLILNLMRKIYQSIDQIKETGSFSLQGLRGSDLKGKTIGIVGTGRIGKEVIAIAKGFGMKVIAFDAYPDKDFAITAGITYVDFEELIKNADVVSFHCPYNETTHHLINQKNIGSVKRGAYLVNTARGAVVETEAIISGLRDGILAGYAADVLEEEGDTKDELHLMALGHPKEEELRVILGNHVLMKMPNVLITPHNAFNSEEALKRILDITIRNIQSFATGKPQNAVPL